MHDPTRWDAWANLASALSDAGEEPKQAVRAFQRAIVLVEGSERSGGGEGEFNDYLAKLYFGLGNALISLTPSQCLELASAPDSLLIVGEAGEGRDAEGRSLVCVENAQSALRTTLELEPSHAEHMLAALLSTEGSRISKASPQFVSALFDDFASSFDQKLAALHYKAFPQFMVAGAATWLSKQWGKRFETALDAGCGTGLAGSELKPLVRGRMVGVDLSPKMLERAAALVHQASSGGMGEKVYDALLTKDLLSLSHSDLGFSEGVELIVAADVLVYFGELSSLLASFAQLAAQERSALIFTCERTTEELAPQVLSRRTARGGAINYLHSPETLFRAEGRYRSEIGEEF
ncbi:MAG: hypothetical protein SGPRY_007773 [Prymnesium sp.]